MNLNNNNNNNNNNLDCRKNFSFFTTLENSEETKLTTYQLNNLTVNNLKIINKKRVTKCQSENKIYSTEISDELEIRERTTISSSSSSFVDDHFLFPSFCLETITNFKCDFLHKKCENFGEKIRNLNLNSRFSHLNQLLNNNVNNNNNNINNNYNNNFNNNNDNFQLNNYDNNHYNNGNNLNNITNADNNQRLVDDKPMVHSQNNIIINSDSLHCNNHLNNNNNYGNVSQINNNNNNINNNNNNNNNNDNNNNINNDQVKVSNQMSIDYILN